MKRNHLKHILDYCHNLEDAKRLARFEIIRLQHWIEQNVNREASRKYLQEIAQPVYEDLKGCETFTQVFTIFESYEK